MRNITLSADAEAIDLARQRAASENTTLNRELRKWLERYARRYQAVRALDAVRELQAKHSTGGHYFTRSRATSRATR